MPPFRLLREPCNDKGTFTVCVRRGFGFVPVVARCVRGGHPALGRGRRDLLALGFRGEGYLVHF